VASAAFRIQLSLNHTVYDDFTQNLAPSIPRHDGAQSIEIQSHPQSRLEILAKLRDKRAFSRLGRASNLTLVHESVIQIKYEICAATEHMYNFKPKFEK
jgi:hypothetical protein